MDEIQLYIDKYNIDVNYDDGHYFDYGLYRDDVIEFINLLIKNGANIHLNDEGLLREASHEGKLEIVKYLIEIGADYTKLYNSY